MFVDGGGVDGGGVDGGGVVGDDYVGCCCRSGVVIVYIVLLIYCTPYIIFTAVVFSGDGQE